MEVSELEENAMSTMLIRTALQNGLPAYGDPRVIEGRFFQVQQDWAELRHQQTRDLMRVISSEGEIRELSVDFKSFKKDFDHFITEHYNPMQQLVDELASKLCRCHTIGPRGRMEPGWMSLRGHSFYLRRAVTPSSGSGDSSAPDLDPVSSSEDEGSFKTSRSEMQGITSSPGSADAAGGADSQVGVGVWDGSGEVGVGEGGGEEERSPPS
jgi:hypothetical protein